VDDSAPQNYWVVQQTADEIRDPENAPAVSVPPFLLSTNRMQLLNTISIYGERGASRQVARVLYMNDVALAIWREMGKNFDVRGTCFRPPRSATLLIGVPHSSDRADSNRT
jgi:hypothetical protein